MEAYPTALQASIERRNRQVAAGLGSHHGPSPEFVIINSLKWPQNKTIKVAFLDGSSVLHKAVADTASEWCQYCNLKLDFGVDPATGKYRRWTTSDQTRVADVRISFDRDGYWSLVGTDCDDPQIGNPADPDGGRPSQWSMNFGGFKEELPHDFAGVVLHEFGHALGLEHEHQHPTEGCEAEFRWADDPGYVSTVDQFGQFIIDSHGRRPGIYTALGGPPNNWPKAVVDFNLRQLTDSHAFTFSAFDRNSIMKYFFPSWMFRSGSSSHCFSAGENVVLSPVDKRGMWETYPTNNPPTPAPGPEIAGPEVNQNGAELAARLEQRRSAALAQIIRAIEGDEARKSHYQSLQSK